ncbi:hypothetical protein NC651_027129 [Populus alba x Populus x berolinensis]|nr:hypothetical protein NC651_027129 [Populus alba x Populus x berolinensis]
MEIGFLPSRYCGIGRPKRSLSLSASRENQSSFGLYSVHFSCGAEYETEDSLVNISTQD